MSTTSILIASFDKNRDLWPLFDFFFQKYWPDCPYQIYLGANGKAYPEAVPGKLEDIHKGPDNSWSESMLEYMQEIPTDTVLLMLDDYILTGKPRTSEIANAVEYAAEQAVYVRLNPEPRPRTQWKQDPVFGELRYFDRYRASLKAAVWNTRFLLDMLSMKLDPWTFELSVGAKKEHRKLLFLSAFEQLLPNRHCVEAGKYTYWLPEYLKQERYDRPLHPDRPVLSYQDYQQLFGKAGKLKRKIVELLPARLYYYYQKLKRDV
ncbi:MAG: hypothetical protein U5P10_05855 [Spirochaetia bacterium]|nr:hypothetical protein [Spirochaetia bacterium]